MGNRLTSMRPSNFARDAEAALNIRPRRYQRGSLSIMEHRNTPDAWVYRYYTNENGRRI